MPGCNTSRSLTCLKSIITAPSFGRFLHSLCPAIVMIALTCANLAKHSERNSAFCLVHHSSYFHCIVSFALDIRVRHELEIHDIFAHAAGLQKSIPIKTRVGFPSTKVSKLSSVWELVEIADCVFPPQSRSFFLLAGYKICLLVVNLCVPSLTTVYSSSFRKRGT